MDNLIDPFKERPEEPHKKMHLETLWFQAGEQEWLDERQHPNYFDEKIQEQEDQENDKFDIEMGIHRKKNNTILEMFSRRRHKK